MTLVELTNQEAGIVVRGDTVIVANWAQSCPDGGLPLLAPWGQDLIAWPANELRVVKEYDVDDIRAALPGEIIPGAEDGTIKTDGMDIVHDRHGDIPALWGYKVGGRNGAEPNLDGDGQLLPTAGKVYVLDDSGETVVIIAPETWA